MSSENARLNDRPSEPVRIGGLIGLFGGIVGAAAAAIFLVSYLSIFHPFDAPLAISWAAYGQGFLTSLLLVVAFLVLAIIGWRAASVKRQNLTTGLVQLAIGLVLTIFGLLYLSVDGPFIIAGAFLVMLSGVVLTWAAFADCERH